MLKRLSLEGVRTLKDANERTLEMCNIMKNRIAPERLTYWITPSMLGMSEDDICKVRDFLWGECLANSREKCPDCGVSKNQQHEAYCDVARCTKCKGQHLVCSGTPGEHEPDKWTGIWPGNEEAYKRRLITFSWNHGIGWRLDLNTLATQQAQENGKQTQA